jgi:glucose 1-dehydrogenase
MFDLTGKIALITGAGRGIGRGCAVELARRGARIVVNFLDDRAQAEGVARECLEAGGDGIAIQADVGDKEAVDRLFAQAMDHYGGIDILVNNALKTVRKPFLELTREDVRETWEICLMAPFYCSQIAARRMVEQGRGGKIVMIGSVLAFVPMPTSLAYNTAKAGLEHMTRTMAAELAPHRINVNVVEPGWTDTPGERAFLAEEELQREAAKLPLGRMATIWEMGQAVAYLCSPAADYITGTMLRVDGGYCLPRVAAPEKPE